MTNSDISASYRRQAEAILEESESIYNRNIWNLVMRRSQEVVELSLKSVLRSAGIEVPHLHDVGILLKNHREKLPASLTRDLDKIIAISRRLRREREISFYGDEETGAAPDEIYSKTDARTALNDARFVMERCR